MPEPEWLFSLAGVTSELPDEAAEFRFHYAVRHGTMKLGLYAPQSEDVQGPHKQDELYVIVSGHGTFQKGGVARSFAPKDVIFVEAGVKHRFADFTDDFSTWVIFWGPEGGEG